MGIVIGIVILVAALFSFFAFRAVQETIYWKKCEKEYGLLKTAGYSNKEALLNISKKRHPELSENIHYAITEKFNSLPLLVNFFGGALPNGNVSDETANRYVAGTTIEYLGPDRYKVRINLPKMD